MDEVVCRDSHDVLDRLVDFIRRCETKSNHEILSIHEERLQRVEGQYNADRKSLFESIAGDEQEAKLVTDLQVTVGQVGVVLRCEVTVSLEDTKV